MFLHVRYCVHIMSSKYVIPITEARTKIFSIADDVQKSGLFYTITQRGRARAVIMSAKEYESWMETLEVMSAFPNLDDDIERAQREYKQGKYTTVKEMREKGERTVIKSARKHAVHRRRSPKRKKGAR